MAFFIPSLPGVVGGLVSGIVGGLASGSISLPKPSGSSSSSNSSNSSQNNRPSYGSSSSSSSNNYSSSSSSSSNNKNNNTTTNNQNNNNQNNVPTTPKYYTDNTGKLFVLNNNGLYTDYDEKGNAFQRLPYSSNYHIKNNIGPYSDGNGNRISVNYNSNTGKGTYLLTNPTTGKIIAEDDFNAYLTGDESKKNTEGYLYRGNGAGDLNNQLLNYVKQNYLKDSDTNNANYTAGTNTPFVYASNNVANPYTNNYSSQNTNSYSSGSTNRNTDTSSISNYNYPSVNTPVSQNTGGLGIYNGITNDKNTYDKIQQMKNFSQMWAAYNDPNVREQMALNAQMIGNTIPGAYRGNDGVWYTADGGRLYDTIYQPLPSESTIPQGNFLSKEDIMAEYNAMADAQAASIEAQLSALLNEMDLQKDNTNSAYDDIARQAYINSRQSEMALPQQLAAQGITGGAAESTLLGLAANYENNLYDNEKARQSQLAEIANNELQARLNANTQISDIRANATSAAFDAYLNQMAAQNAYNQWAYEVAQNMNNNDWQKQQAEREWAYNLANNAYLMSQQDRENDITDKNNIINWALTTGDYSGLQGLGFDTSYLEDTQENTLLQLALEAERQKLANQAAQMQLASYSLPSYSSSSSGSSRSTSSSSGKSSSSSASSGNIVSRNKESSGTNNTNKTSSNVTTTLRDTISQNPLGFDQYYVFGYPGKMTGEMLENYIKEGKVKAYKNSSGKTVYQFLGSI